MHICVILLSIPSSKRSRGVTVAHPAIEDIRRWKSLTGRSKPPNGEVDAARLEMEVADHMSDCIGRSVVGRSAFES